MYTSKQDLLDKLNHSNVLNRQDMNLIKDVLKKDFGKKTNVIDEFKGENAFLSNFFECKMVYNGKMYKNSEAAFQAQKCPERVDEFTGLNPSEAKKLGRHVDLRPDWEDVKDLIMTEVVEAKFNYNPNLKQMLLDTGDADLVEGNTWNDRYWGVCKGIGQNKLGKILMMLREEFKND